MALSVPSTLPAKHLISLSIHHASSRAETGHLGGLYGSAGVTVVENGRAARAGGGSVELRVVLPELITAWHVTPAPSWGVQGAVSGC